MTVIGLVLVMCLLVLVSCGAPPPELPSPPTLPEPTPYSTVSIPIEEFPNHPHIDVVMHAVVGMVINLDLGG